MQDIKQVLKDKFSQANNNSSQISKWLWIFIISGIGLFITILVFTSMRGIPTFEELENPQYDQASIIYDHNGNPFGKYYVENREPISFNQLNKYIKDALISTEDTRFYQHCGIDFWALMRVGVKSILLQRESSGGGSTISQQLAKLLYKRPRMSGKNFLKRAATLIEVKIKEWLIAVKLEKTFTKEEIMAMYLNQFEFINGAHGIQSAAQTYFNKDQSLLDIDEAALLVGMLKNPSLYNPLRFPEKAINRRNTVLALMNSNKVINATQKDTLSAKKIDMSHFTREEQSDGPAPYFRAELTKYLQKLFKDKNINKSDGTPYNVYTDGLKIYTTIDLNYQKYAEEAMKEHMAWLQKRYFKVWKGMDPWTYKADDFQKKLRQDVLSSKVKGSERYLILREKNLAKILEKVSRKYPKINTSDNVLDRLIEIENADGNFNVEGKTNAFAEEENDKYQSFMNTEIWETLKDEYKKHLLSFEKEFSQPVSMMMFDHDEGEKQVEMSPLDSVKYLNQHLQNAMLAVDPHNGHIKAWVGGINHKYFKYDHVTSRRSVGSTIKPFVYTTAMAVGGISPCEEFEDIQYTIAPDDAGFNVDKEWSPANATEKFTGNKYNLYHGLLYSKNSITVRLLKELGTVEVVRDLLDKVGISKTETLSNGRLAVPRVPSICLGAIDISLLQMTGAYTAFANQGVYTEPIFITRIEDKNGKEIYTGIPKKTTAINPLYNAIMVDMLKNVVGGQFGMGLKVENGGKTGTTNDYADGWFMGITPNLVVGVWTGGDDKWIAFTSLDDGQGYVMARPAYQKFLKKLESDSTGIFNYKTRFANPPEGFAEMIDCDKYKTVKPDAEHNQIMQEKAKKDEFDDEFDQ